VARVQIWEPRYMHQINGVRDPGATFTLVSTVDEAGDRRQANLAVGWGGVGLAVTGLIELALAVLSGSVALLGDALHNLSDVSTSVLVFIGFRASKRLPTDRYPYGYDRAEDLAGVGIAVVIWASAAFAGVESVRKLLGHGGTHYVVWAIAGAAVGILGNQIVARIKLRIGKRINSATLIADAKHSWLDALSSAGALIGLIGVLTGLKWADAVAGIVVTAFICHVGWEVSSDIVHRLMDGVDPEIIATAERAAADVPGVRHAHARARWTGRILRVEIEGWVDGQTTVTEADRLGQTVADRLATEIPDMRNFTWTARSV
jgi:cation diffusion facilitator family transporter